MAARQAPPVDRPHTPALPATDRQRNGGTQEGANGAAHSEAGLGKAGARTRARSSPPPRHTDPPAADRAAPDAHGRPATPTAQAYPKGARRRQRMTGAGATGHPTGQGGGEHRTSPPSPPPRSPPGLRAAGAPALRPPGAEGTSPLPQKGRRRQGGDADGPARRAPRRPRPPAPAAVAADRGARTSAPEQRTDHIRGRHATTNRISMGAAPPMTRASQVTPQSCPLGEGRGGGWVCRSPRGSGSRAAPPPPPSPARQAAPGARGGPATPTELVRRGGNAPATRGEQGREPQAAPQRESRGGAA